MAADVSSTSSSSGGITLSGLIKGLGGIAASVIAGVSIYYLTRTPPPPPQPTRAMEFYGVVADAEHHTLIPNATIVLAVGQNSVSQRTDSLGQYNVALESTVTGVVMGSMQISANGYQSYSNTVKLHPGTNFAEIALESNAHAPVAAPEAPHAETPAGGGAIAEKPVRAGIIFSAPPRNFNRTQSAVVLRAKQ